jgi:GT2 family glycosyltransferase
MDATVVVPTYERPNTLERTLESLIDQSVDSYDIVVVDDGSTSPEQEAVLTRFADEDRVTVVRQSNQGPAAARNRGWRETTADVVLFTDDDCEPPRNWIESLVSEFDTGIAAVGGPLVPPASIADSNAVARFTRYRDRFAYDEPDEPTVGVKGLAVTGTANVAYRRSVLEEAGGFDESFPIAGGEDADLGRRVRALGYELAFVPVPVVHHDDYSLGSFVNRAFRGGIGTHQFHAKHGGRRSIPRVLLGLLASPGWFLPTLVRSRSPAVATLFVLERILQRLGELHASRSMERS